MKKTYKPLLNAGYFGDFLALALTLCLLPFLAISAIFRFFKNFLKKKKN